MARFVSRFVAAIAAALTISSSALAQQSLGAVSSALVPSIGSSSATTPSFDLARESLALSRVPKPSDPDVKIISKTTAFGLGVGAAGVGIAGLLLLTKLLSTKETRPKDDHGPRLHVLRISTKGAVVGLKAAF